MHKDVPGGCNFRGNLVADNSILQQRQNNQASIDLIIHLDNIHVFVINHKGEEHYRITILS